MHYRFSCAQSHYSQQQHHNSNSNTDNAPSGREDPDVWRPPAREVPSRGGLRGGPTAPRPRVSQDDSKLPMWARQDAVSSQRAGGNVGPGSAGQNGGGAQPGRSTSAQRRMSNQRETKRKKERERTSITHVFQSYFECTKECPRHVVL